MNKIGAKRGISLLLVFAMFFSMAALQPGVLAATDDPASAEYELYPIPQSITYEDRTIALPSSMNVFYGSGIDEYTKARAVEAFQEVGVTLVETAADQASVLVGVASAQDAALTGIGGSVDDEVFTKNDGYRMKTQGNQIYVVGRHTDAAFYGLTTLLQMLQQVDDRTRRLRCFDISDWADVASRGFIEADYGNDLWSIEDRVELMRWSGYYKLNSYVYATDDDPKRDSQWRELYTEEELQSLIAPLAKAGNESKCQFVYALAPFDQDSIKGDNYDASLETLKAKFEQTMQYGVRQIAVTVDTVWGDQELQIQLMEDLVDWVSLPEMQQKYPGLKTTVPFCPSESISDGDLNYFGENMPETVPLIVTSGNGWGEVSPEFTQSFTSDVGRPPYLWIKWPYTDAGSCLVMGGYTTFLQSGVQPENIQGIVLNPMQQSEPSKVALFGNACYSWNIWTQEEADQAWSDSFKYADHESYEETPASAALRELSKHMINQNMDSRVTKLEESVEIRDLLTRVRSSINSGVTVDQEDITELNTIFTTLKEAAGTYKALGNERIRNQISCWLDAWEEVAEANLKLLEALEKAQNGGDPSLITSNYMAAKSLYDASNQHGFQDVGSVRYAKVGVQHIQPFTKDLLSMVGHQAQASLDPTKPVETPIHSFGDAGESVYMMLDNDTASYAAFNCRLIENDYVGVLFSYSVDIDRVAILATDSTSIAGKLPQSRLQYTTNGTDWQDVPGGDYAGGNLLRMTDLGLKGVMGIRVQMGRAGQSQLIIREIQINGEVEGPAGSPEKFLYHSNDATVSAPDGETDDTHTTLTADSVTLPANAYVGIDLGRIRPVNSVTVQHSGGGAIAIMAGASRSQMSVLALPLDGVKNVRYIELVNTSGREVTIDLTELTASYREVAGPFFLDTTMGIDANYGREDSRNTGTTGNLFDGDLETWVKFSDRPAQGGYILYDLGQTRDVTNLKLYVDGTDIDFIRDGKVQVSMSPDSGWVDVITIGDGVENTDDSSDLAMNSGLYQAASIYSNKLYAEGSVEATQARYLRILFTAPYQNRFVTAREIVINDGEYMPEQNAAFTAVPSEQKGYVPSQVVDGDLTTGFRPNMQGVTEGYLIYRLSEVTDLEQINVIQDAAAVSTGNPVTVYAKGSNTDGEFVVIGQLTETVSNVPVYNTSIVGDIYELKFAWSGITPTIYEINVVPRGMVAVDTSVLADLLNKMPTAEEVNSLGDDYSTALKQAYETAYTNAQALALVPPQYQAQVVEAQNALNDSYGALTEILDAARKKLTDQIAAYSSLDPNQYMAESWSVYRSALSAARAAQAKTALSDIDVMKQAYEDLVQAYDHLQRKSSEKKILRFDIADCDTVIDEQAHTVTVTAPSSTVADNLVPTIVVSDRAQVRPGSGTAWDFTGPAIYEVTAEDGSKQEYVVTVDVLPDGVYLVRRDTAVVKGVITTDRQSAREQEKVQVAVDPVTGYTLEGDGIKVYKIGDPAMVVPVDPDGTFLMPPYDVTVSASFEAIQYQITYDLNGGTNHESNPTAYTVENTLILQDPQRDGFSFVGWTYSGMDTPTIGLRIPEGSVTGDLTFTAHWTEEITQEYTVSFNSNGGSAVPSQIVVEGGLAAEPAVPVWSGYRFDGWYTDVSLQTAYDFNTPVTGNLVLYAKWTYAGGSSGGSSGSTTTNTTTTTNPDGSITTTVVHPDGSTTETTKYPDGSQKVVKTDKSGTVTTTMTDAAGNKVSAIQNTDGSSRTTVEKVDGSGSVTVVDKNGQVISTASLSKEAIRAAQQGGRPVALPMPEVPVTTDPENAPTITVRLEATGSVAVEIPVADVTAGTVAMMVKADGTQEVIKNCFTTDNGVVVALSDGDTVKIVDTSKLFLDVPSSHWAADAIAFVSSHGLFSGTGENTFSPETAMTRGMIVTVLASYEGADTSAGDRWYDAGRRWAMENGVSDGTGMEQSLTREQMATMLWRYAGSPSAAVDMSGYTDASTVSSWASEAMAWAMERGIISGTSSTTLSPKGLATRAQVATILMRFVEKTV